MRALRLLLVSALAAAGLSVVVMQPASAAASVSGFSQCANGATGVACAGWVNGSLGSNSHYAEDNVVPQRVLISLPADNLEHSLTFTYQDRKGSVHAYDSLGTWNETVTNADPCQGIAAALCSNGPSQIDMTSDPANIPAAAGGNSTAVSAHELPQADRQWTMYGGVLTTDVAATHSSPASGDDLATVTVKFRNATPGASTTGVLLFGGHLAVGGPNTAPRAWGVNLGATSVSGGPYAFKLEAVDGGSTGATANSIQASGVAPLPPAVYTVTKTASASAAAAGSQVTYTITVKNTGGQAGSTTFTDDYNNNLTSVSTPSGCTAGSGSMSCTTGTIQPGGQQVFSYTANLPLTFSGGAGTGGCSGSNYPVSNTATLANNTSATALVCVSAAAQFTVTKTASPTNPNPGQTVTYTITVTNTGNAAGSTTFSDDYDNRLSPSVPAGCTDNDDVLACTTGSLGANGGNQIFTYTAVMPGSFDGGTTCVGGYQISNKVTVAGGPEATRNVCVQAAPAFTVVKSVSDTIAQPGQVVTYTLTVKNTGKASGSTSVTDTPAAGITLGALPSGCSTNPTGSFTCSTGSILAGAEKVFTYTATMPTSFDGSPATDGCAANSYAISNTAVIGSSSSTKTVCVGAVADFTITKSATPASATPGQVVTYTVKVKNVGPASGSTTFVDDYANVLSPSLPTSATTGSCTQGEGLFNCSSGTVLSGATVTFTYTAQMPATYGAVSGGPGCASGTYPIGNTATLASGPFAANTVCVTAAPKYTITKTVDKPAALPSDVITYKVTVKNTGSAAGSTTFADDYDNRLVLSPAVLAPLGGSCSAAAGILDCTTAVIAAGGQQTFTYSATLPATYSGTAGAGTCTTGTYRLANTATLANTTSDSAQVCVTASPRFVVDKSVNNESPAPGDVLTYSIKVTNVGSAAGSTSFVDDYDNRLTPSVPSGCTAAGGELTCSTGTILATASQTFTYTATLPSTFTGPGGGGSCAPGAYAFENTADLDGGPADSVTACVVAAPSFSITKVADDTTVTAGDVVTYKVKVTNSGAASGATSFVDDYDNRLSPSVPSGCTAAGGKLTCTTDDIASGASQTFTYTATVPATFASDAAKGTCATGSYAVANTATLSGGAAARVQVCVSAAPAFTVTKVVDDAHVAAGDVITYTITVKNTGTAGGSTLFTDDLDDRLSPSDAVSVPAGNSCTPISIGGDVSFLCPTGTIEPAAQQTFKYTAAMPMTFTGQNGGSGCSPAEYRVNNTAVVGASQAAAFVCVAAAPDFTITKTADDTTVSPGDAVHYKIVVTNNGNAAGATSFTDDYDATATVATPPSGCVADLPNTAFSCTTGTINAGASQTFTYTGSVPSSFVGDPDGSACAPPAYSIVNRVKLLNDRSAKVTVCVGAAADFSILKSVADGSVGVGDPVQYTVRVTNTGTATGTTTFTDAPDSKYSLTGVTVAGCTQAGGVFTCSTGNLNAGQHRDFVFNLTAPLTFSGNAGGGSCGSGTFLLTNMADLTDGPASSVDVCVTAAPVFVVTKKADDTTVAAGDVVKYTITVANNGTAAGTSSFVDDYDNRLTPSAVGISGTGGSCAATDGTLECSTGTIAAGSSQTFTYTAAMPATFSGDPAAGCSAGAFPVKNTVAGATDDSVTVCVAAAPVYTVKKTASTELTTPGQPVTYTIKVANEGTASGSTTFTDDYDNRLTLTAPAGCTAAAGSLSCTTDVLEANTSQSFVYTATLPATFSGDTGGPGCAADEFRVANTVTLANGAARTVVVCVDADAQFAISKSADDLTANPGQTVGYKVTVTNNGTAPGGTTFTDDYNNRLTPTVPAGCVDNGGSFTCTTGKIPAGGSQDFTYSAAMPLTFGTLSGTFDCPAGSYGIKNEATLQDGPADSKVVCVAAAPDLDITKVADDDTVVPGQTVGYTITVTNSGPAAALPTTFVDDYTDTMTDVTVPAGCTAGSGQFTCTTDVIDSGQSQVFSYSAKVPAAFTGDSGTADCPTGTFPVANSVSVDGGPSDDVKLCVPAAPKFKVTKTVDDAVVAPGTTVTYQVTVKNIGDASGATTFGDDYDNRLDPTVPAGCTKAAGELSCTTDVLAANASQVFTYSAVVPSTFTGDVGGGDCGPGAFRIANSATTVGGSVASQDVCVTAAPLFTVAKSVDKPKALPGDSVHYKVTVTNTGAAAGATTVVDDFDNRLQPTIPNGCTAAGGKLTCTTATILSGASQTFEYDAVLPLVYSGTSGVAPCDQGEYSVANSVSLGDVVAASKTVCVAAAPKLSVTKKADDTTAEPGQTVTYTVTVANTGSVAGSTVFVDDYDNRLTPTMSGGCTAADGKLTCTSEVLQPGTQQVFTYSATMPATYTGPSGLGGCATGSFPVGNSVVLDNGANASVTVCTAASPTVTLAKTASLDTGSNGDQTITYTLTYKNTGAAEALGTVVTDPVPAGTGFVSCSATCTTPGGVATWNVGSVAPAGGTGTLTLVVKVTSNQTCVITNTAQVKVGSAPAIPSNTVTTNVTPQPDTANAKASGSAVGLSIRTSGLLDLIGPLVGGLFTNNNTLTLSRAASSQNGLGGPATSSDSLLSLKLPANGSLVRAGVLTATSASSVTAAPAEARQTTTSEVAGVCVIPVAGLCTVETGTVRAVATTMANGAYASISSAGSTIENLKVAGLVIPVDLSQTTTIPLNKAIFGANSYVAINERTGTSGLSGQKYVADQSVAMIHVKITGLLLGVQAAEVYVAQAVAHSEFPKTFLCAGAKNQSVSGHAYTARLYTGPLLADLLQGYAQISPLGGAESEHIAQAVIPSTGVIVNAKVGDSSAAGSFNGTSSTSRSWAEIAGDGAKPACVISYVANCVAKATLIRSEARSNANAAGSVSTDTGTSLVGLSVLGIPLSGTPAPNTTLALPGIGFIILNEQFCDNGASVSHSCSATGHTGLTVRAVRIVVTVANNILGLTPGIELVVAEAHADTTFN